MKKKRSYSFMRGYKQLRVDQTKDFKLQLMGALDIKTRSAFQARLKGEVEPRMSEAIAIEATFKRFNITDFWGDK
jgi:hypothetical protein